MTDVTLWAIPSCIVGARTYYVLFYLDLYRNPDGSLDWGSMIAIWDGGLAIYGTVIVSIIVVFVFTRVKKLKFAAMMDCGVLGLLLGQIIGRWANFINREAFGGLTDLPWRMRLWTSQFNYIEVHPTFFYESMWNLVGLLLMIFIVSRGRRFDGENTWFYFLWYGVGRFWIEGLRTDSLYLFDWTILGQPIRVSQALSAVMAVVAAFMLFYNIKIKKKTADGLWVNQLAAAKAGEAAAAKANVGNIPTIIKTASKADTILGNRFFIVYQILSVLGIKNTANTQRTIIAPAKVQVAFSRKSVVFLTPIIWLDDAKEDAKPPPFEFCTNTININKIQIMNTKTEIAVYIIIIGF